MDKALELEKILRENQSQSSCGAVIVKNNQIVGQGYHQG